MHFKLTGCTICLMNGIEGRPETKPGQAEYQSPDRISILPDEVYQEICRRFSGYEIPHPDIKRVLVLPDREHLSQAAAQQKIEIGKRNPRGFYLNPTGFTFEPIHEIVTAAAQRGEVDFSQTSASHLDAYYPYSITGLYSFPGYIMRRVIVRLGIPEGNYRLIDEEAEDPNKEARMHNEWIKRFQPAMIQLGVGPDGHLAFILPGTPFDVETHYTKLSQETIHRDRVERLQDTPDCAITIGPKNIIDGAVGHIQVVFSGAQKGKKLNEALTGPVTPDHTASLLRLPHVGDAVTVLCDAEAARQFTW